VRRRRTDAHAPEDDHRCRLAIHERSADRHGRDRTVATAGRPPPVLLAALCGAASGLVPRIDAADMLTAPPGHAIDTTLARLFPQGAEQREDDLAAILVNLKQPAIVAEPSTRPRIAPSN
jgi:hypothetical protein